MTDLRELEIVQKRGLDLNIRKFSLVKGLLSIGVSYQITVSAATTSSFKKTIDIRMDWTDMFIKTRGF